MNLEHTSARQLFSFGYLVTEERRADLALGGLSLLIDAIISSVIPPEVLRLEPIIDMKGGDPADTSSILSHTPCPEELFFVAGTFPRYDSESRTIADEQFSFCLSTAFSSFKGAAHICHSVTLQERGTLSSIIPVHQLLPRLGRAFPLVPTCLRLSLDLFEGHFFSYFGFAPVATQHVLIEATRETVRVRMVCENAPTRDSAPIRDGGLYRKIQAAVG